MSKTLKELTIKDNFMFGAVMMDEENCRGLLELVLGIPIQRVEVSKEKSMIYHPEYRGVRLDVYARDDKNTHYNVEMQVAKKNGLERRARYYHSQIDMDLLVRGLDYSELPKSYVIFICDFDPFGRGKYCYTFENLCKEIKDFPLDDGVWSIFLNTKGRNVEEVSSELVKFLKYVGSNLQESTRDFQDSYVSKLQNAVLEIKKSREMEGRYMLLEELLKDERKEGIIQERQNSILELLEDLGKVPDELRDKILKETDLEVLRNYRKKAMRAGSIEQFLESIN